MRLIACVLFLVAGCCQSPVEVFERCQMACFEDGGIVVEMTEYGDKIMCGCTVPEAYDGLNI